MSQIANRNILVTGGASGMGRQTAKKLAALGGNIAVWDIDAANLDAVVREISSAGGGTVRGFLCDVSDRDTIYRVAETTKAAVGAIDILINNAGVVSGKPLLDIPDEQVERTFKINTLALFWTAKAFVPDMVKRNSGHVVTLSSASALIGVARLSDYSASKWAAMSFDESLRFELKKMGSQVRTTVVCPYYVDTGMFKGVKSRFPWLLPILDEEYVANHIVNAIRRNRPRVMLPRIVYTVPMMRILPVRVFDWTATFLGVNASMDDFVGRSGGEGKH
jgi:all-trans-retinol dehydrogenase (NAD+)